MSASTRPLPVAKPPPGPRFFTRWDVLVAVVLGLGLVTAGRYDVAGYLAHRGKPQSAFSLLTPPAGERLGDDEFFHYGSTIVHASNLGGLEPLGRKFFRHCFGPVETLEIWSSYKEGSLSFGYYNGVPGQEITFAYNGETLETLHECPEGHLARNYHLALHQGANAFTISVSRYNHHGVELAPDQRPIAGTFDALDFTPY